MDKLRGRGLVWGRVARALLAPAAKAAWFGVFMLPVSSSSRKALEPVGLIRRRTSSRRLVPLLTAVLACWVSAEPEAGAAPDNEAGYQGGAYLHPDLERAAAAWGEARGGAAYTALREVWQQWDRADPGQVEEALREASASPKLTPAQRAYAELLVAYARLRRGDGHDAQRRISELGYVDRWLVLGPFDNTGKTGYGAVQGPESELNDPAVWERTYAG